MYVPFRVFCAERRGSARGKSDVESGVDYRGKTRLVATSSEKIEATTINGARENGWWTV